MRLGESIDEVGSESCQMLRYCLFCRGRLVQVGSRPLRMVLNGAWKDGAGELAGTLTMGLDTVLVVHSVGRT